MKQKLAQKLREELGGVLETCQTRPKAPEEEPDLGAGLKKDKSARDILIRQKVEEKKKNFAALKS